jgi:hypothetical protein
VLRTNPSGRGEAFGDEALRTARKRGNEVAGLACMKS